MCNTKELQEIFNEVKRDNFSGSGTLLYKLISGLSECSGNKNDTAVTAEQETKQLFTVFRDEMKDFAVISHFCNYMIENLGKHQKQEPVLTDLIAAYTEKWKDVNNMVAAGFLRSIEVRGKTVLLHSQSSAVISLFSKLGEKSHETGIIQTESRPVMEGRRQAEKIAGLGFSVKMVTDTGFTPLLDEIDMAILGADTIYKDHFINKTGSYAIALLCREKNIPVYVLADSRKFINSNHPKGRMEKPKPDAEIWNDPPQNIKPVNYYFETVPINLITGFFSEKDQ